MPENLPFPECGEISKTLYELVAKHNIECFVFSFPVRQSNVVVTFAGQPDHKTGNFIIGISTDEITPTNNDGN
jgi:hypothetical protein